MSEKAGSFVSGLRPDGIAGQENTSHKSLGPHTARLNEPKLVTEIDPASPEEIILTRVRDDFMQRLQEHYCLRPIGELEESVSNGYLPTARMRFYPEIIIGPVTDWLHTDKVKPRALRGEYLDFAEFERYYQGQRRHESQDWLWQKLVESRKPESGQWR